MPNDEESSSWLVDGTTDPDEVARRYDDWAAGYDADLESWSYAAPEVVTGIVLTEAPEAASVLDAGCGTGLVGQALRRHGFAGTIDGCDISEESLRIAGADDTYTTLVPADLQQRLPVDDDAVDVLTCVGVMTYVPDVESAWREFARVVRPGGVVVVTQREDVWDERECQQVVDALAADGIWTPIGVTDPQPYLPDNPDGMGPVGVRYVTARIV